MKLFITIILSFVVFEVSGQDVMFLKKRRRIKKVEKQVKDKVSRKSSATKKNRKNKSLKNRISLLEKQNKTLKRMAMIRLDSMSVWESGPKLRIGDMVGGILKLSVLSTNLGSPIIVDVTHESLPDGGKVLCTGTTKHKRVMASCNTLVTPYDEIPINATILDADGSHGMRGVLSTGKEKYIAGIFASEMMTGALTVAQDRTATANGSITNPTSKNMILQGLANTGGAATDIMKESMTTEEPKVFIKSGKRVLIFFNATVKNAKGES